MSLPPSVSRFQRLHPGALERLPLDWSTYPQLVLDDLLAALEESLLAGPSEGDAAPAFGSGTLALPPQAPQLIVVQGDPRAGKDVVANYLRDTYARVGTVMTSTAIRAEVNEYLSPYGHLVVEGNKSLPHYRHLLQAWGMARQEEDPDYWPRRALAQAQHHVAADGARCVVITGLRWPHDALRYRENGARLWRVERPGNPYVAEHYAENGFADVPSSFWDLVLINGVEGSFQQLHQDIDAGVHGG